MAFVPNSNSVVSFQSDPAQLQASITGTVSLRNLPSVYGNISGSVAAWLQSTNASIITVNAPITNQSVSGTVGASLIGLSPVNVVGPITGSVQQGTSPWIIGSVYGNVSGSVAAFQIGSWSASLVGTIPGSVVAFQGTVPWTIGSVYGNVSGSVVAFQGGTRITSVSGTITGSVQAAVAGSVVSFQGGAWSTSVMTNVITSIATAGQVMGSVAALQATNPWNIAGSVAAYQAGVMIASVIAERSSTSSVYAVLSSITSVSILSANASRKGATLYNNADTNVFVKLGTAATTSIFTVNMVSGSYYEIPYGWTGVVAGISASNAGIVTVTELS